MDQILQSHIVSFFRVTPSSFLLTFFHQSLFIFLLSLLLWSTHAVIFLSAFLHWLFSFSWHHLFIFIFMQVSLNTWLEEILVKILLNFFWLFLIFVSMTLQVCAVAYTQVCSLPILKLPLTSLSHPFILVIASSQWKCHFQVKRSDMLPWALIALKPR